MSKRPVLALVLAAGRGTRIKSSLPKVLHKVAGRSMLSHVLSALREVPCQRVGLVVGGSEKEEVSRHARGINPDIQVYEQHKQQGTADAVLAAREFIKEFSGDLVVLCADTPLLRSQTIRELLSRLDTGYSASVLGFYPKSPSGYGRLIVAQDSCLLAIREDKDASNEERELSLCNAGLIAFRFSDEILSTIDKIDNNNSKREYHLTSVVELLHASGNLTGFTICSANEVLGVNTRIQLAHAEELFQQAARNRAMDSGVTMVCPQTVWLSYDTELASDVILEPNIFFGPSVSIGQGTHIKANCYLEGVCIGSRAVVGPFARLRPGSVICDDVRIGNYVEIKNTFLGKGAKANHLSYLGDGSVGAGANIGAGTIFCNYDGYNKSQTIIGEDAFIGSNTSLVAPVKVGEGAYIGSGSVITKDVSSGSLALSRIFQREHLQWAKKFQTMMRRKTNKSR